MAEQERRVQAGPVETLEAAEAAEAATPVGSAPIAPVRMIARTATLARSTPAEPTAAAYRVSRAAGRPRSAAAARVRSVVPMRTAATATIARTIAVSAAPAPTLPTTRSARRTSTVRSTRVAVFVKFVLRPLPAPIRVRARPIAAPTTAVFTTTARTARCVARTAAAPSVATIRNALRRMLVTRALALRGSARWSNAARASNAVTTARVRRPAAIAAARPNATTTSPVRTTGAPRVPARTRRIPASVRGTTPVIRFAVASRLRSVHSTPIALCSNARPLAARPGKCNYSGCGGNLRCCAGVGCRTCCQNTDCNDGVACTDDTCEGGTCRYTPKDTNCSATGAGFHCDPTLGCIQCTSSDQCQNSNLCMTGQCVNNRCFFAYKDCGVGQFCCSTTGVCGQCCSDCDCGGIISSPEEPAIPPPLDFCKCLNGTCVASTACAC